MKFISMDLVNFRQYRNAHIDFSCSEDKNVTLILGDNGSGKTTFVQAFYWCFYNATSFEDKNLINSDIVDESPEGKELTVEVKLLVEYGMNIYEIKRIEKYEKNNGSIQKKRKYKGEKYFTILDKTTGRLITNEEQAEALIERMLPSELSRYFFFDGETMDVMSEVLFSRSKSTDIAAVIQSVVGLRSLQQLRRHLKQVDTAKKTLIRKINEEIDYTGGQELQSLSAQIDKLQDNITSLDRRAEQTVEMIADARQRKDDIKAWLANHPDVVELENTIESLEQDKKVRAQKRDEQAETLIQNMKVGRE